MYPRPERHTRQSQQALTDSRCPLLSASLHPIYQASQSNVTKSSHHPSAAHARFPYSYSYFSLVQASDRARGLEPPLTLLTNADAVPAPQRRHFTKALAKQSVSSAVQRNPT
ncbi:hypothetical protein BKA80DRAFT_286088 [Phyllosticta citrichinensis]